MARTGNHGGKRESSSLTWADVRHLQEQMTGHLGMRIEVAMLQPEEHQAGKLFRVEARAYDWDDPWGKWKHRVVSYWPTPSVATMPGLIVRLFHSLDHVAWHQAQLDLGELRDAPQRDA